MNEFVPYNSHTCQSKTFDLNIHEYVRDSAAKKTHTNHHQLPSIEGNDIRELFFSLALQLQRIAKIWLIFFVCCSIWRSLRWQCRQQHQQQWKLQQLVYYYNNKYNTNFFFIHDSIDFLRKTVLCSIPFRLIGFWFGRLFNFFFLFFFSHCATPLS